LYRKLGRRLGLAVLLAALILPTAATPTKAVSYSATCAGGDGNNYHGYLYHGQIGTEQVDYMSAEVNLVRDIRACNDLLGGFGATFALPVNIQGYANVQLGWGRLGPDNDLAFLYTPNADNVLVEYTGVTLNNTNLNHWWFFRASFYAPTSRWRYEVIDRSVSPQKSYVWYGNSGTHHYGYDSWSGFEVYNTWDQYGGAGVSIEFADIAYQRPGETTNRYYTTGQNFYSCCGTRRSDWINQSGLDPDGHKYLRARSDGF
jgi:hypothetical protein